MRRHESQYRVDMRLPRILAKGLNVGIGITADDAASNGEERGLFVKDVSSISINQVYANYLYPSRSL